MPTLQQAEDALKTSQAAFETAAANLDRARSFARQDGPRPFGTVPTISAAQTAYDTALATRDADRVVLRDAQQVADRPRDAMSDLAANFARPGGR